MGQSRCFFFFLHILFYKMNSLSGATFDEAHRCEFAPDTEQTQRALFLFSPSLPPCLALWALTQSQAGFYVTQQTRILTANALLSPLSPPLCLSARSLVFRRVLSL